MAKYCLERLGSARFEELTQTLLETRFRTGGHLSQFGAGPDGAREATWSQPPEHPDYIPLDTNQPPTPREWVFQAKFHDGDLTGWGAARTTLVAELDAELQKVFNKHFVPCHNFVMITNVPFTGVRHAGTRDKVEAVVSAWRSRANVQVWDATDLCRMLDADPATRTTFLDGILPGDVLAGLLSDIDERNRLRNGTLRAYLKMLVQVDGQAKAEEAGDETGLDLSKVFVDLDVRLQSDENEEIAEHARRLRETARGPSGRRERFVFPATHALLRLPGDSVLLTGGPGVGKSTLTQFACVFHASRLLDLGTVPQLCGRAKLTDLREVNDLDAASELRFPIRIELRRYASWIRLEKKHNPESDAFLARYIAFLINRSASGALDQSDVFTLLGTSPILLVLDGLDEVPDPGVRDEIFAELAVFRTRCGDGDVKTVLSTRPQGYRGEFDGFKPVVWSVQPLSKSDFFDYADIWLQERIPDLDERRDAKERVTGGMTSPAVQGLASSLLQATVMLTIARRKQPIPHARHRLFQRYVDVIFERENTKETVHKHSDVLRKLHEQVGYELMLKMGNEKVDPSLNADDFQRSVLKVLNDYGSESGEALSLNKLTTEITALARDRLCLIAGKGDDQNDVDFVIQPFREYFAATYLARHEDADPERVYEALLIRGHIWTNVLQFYAASQSAAQQKNWITEAECHGESDLVSIVRQRRVLLRLLPEFGPLKNQYRDRALTNLFAPNTLWTWSFHKEAMECLVAFEGSSAYLRLSGVLEKQTLDDRSWGVATALLARIATEHDLGALGVWLSSRLGTSQGRASAQLAILKRDLPFRWWKKFEDWRGVETNPYAFFPIPEGTDSRFVLQLSDDEVLDMLVLQLPGWLHEQVNSTTARWPRKLVDELNPSSSDANDERVALAPFAVDRSSSASVCNWSEQLRTSSALSADYVSALLAAISSPLDAALDERARSSWLSLKSALGIEANAMTQARLGPKNQLGPGPETFASVEEWTTWKRQVLSEASAARSRAEQLIMESPAAYIALISDKHEVPARANDIAIEESCRMLFRHGALSVQSFQFDGKAENSEVEAVNVLTDVLSSNTPPLWEARDESFFLAHVICRILSWDRPPSFDALVELALKKEGSPRTIEMVLHFYSSDEEASIDALLALWRAVAPRPHSWCTLPYGPSHKIVRKLLDADEPQALLLAAHLLASALENGPFARHLPSSNDTLKVLAKDAAKLLCERCLKEPGLIDEWSLSILLVLPPSELELELWALQEVNSKGWTGRALSERFESIVRQFWREIPDFLRTRLDALLESRSGEYGVASAALEARLTLEYLLVPGLTKKDWSQASSPEEL